MIVIIVMMMMSEGGREGERKGELEALRRRCGGALLSLYILVVLPCESSRRGVPLHQLRKKSYNI